LAGGIGTTWPMSRGEINGPWSWLPCAAGRGHETVAQADVILST
jgi:hypothetical protein